VSGFRSEALTEVVYRVVVCKSLRSHVWIISMKSQIAPKEDDFRGYIQRSIGLFA
jgi:hypothetical protein